MKTVHSFDEFKSAVKAGEKDILWKGCSKKYIYAFSAAAACKNLGITSMAGVTSNANCIAANAVSTTVVFIITSALLIVAIIALCKDYNIEVDYSGSEVHVKIKK